MHTNLFSLTILIFWVAFPSPASFAQETPPKIKSASDTTRPIELPELAKELAERVKRDQAARFKLIEVMQLQSTGASKNNDKQENKDDAAAKAKSAALIHDLASIDDDNRAWLKTIVEKHGWPSKKLVGEKGAHDAWLLVQHADADREFQKSCLAKMEQLPDGEVSKIDLAYLTDRVLVAEKKPQVYGTQCYEVDGKFQPREVVDPTNLDQRRHAIGLPPIAEYLQSMQEMYKGK
ncbi:MAG: DUF6624 domain-containing protein [Pirellulaceae bacterium]